MHDASQVPSAIGCRDGIGVRRLLDFDRAIGSTIRATSSLLAACSRLGSRDDRCSGARRERTQLSLRRRATDERLEVAGLPPLAEQRAIADYLDAETARIDALIAKKQQLIHLLESAFRSGLTALVTDHRASRGRMCSEWFGPLPDGWGCARLGSLTTKILDGPHVSPRYVTSRGPFPLCEEHRSARLGSVNREVHRTGRLRVFNRRIQPTTGDVLLTKGGNTASRARSTSTFRSRFGSMLRSFGRVRACSPSI